MRLVVKATLQGDQLTRSAAQSFPLLEGGRPQGADVHNVHGGLAPAAQLQRAHLAAAAQAHACNTPTHVVVDTPTTRFGQDRNENIGKVS